MLMQIIPLVRKLYSGKLYILWILLAIKILYACSQEETSDPNPTRANLQDKADSVAYFVGAKMAAKFKSKEPNFRQLEIRVLLSGFTKYLDGDTTLDCRSSILELAKQNRKSMTDEELKRISYCFGKLNAFECINVFRGFNAHQNLSKSPLINGFEDGMNEKNSLIDSDQSWIYTYEQFITQCNVENEKRLFQKAFQNKAILALDSNVLLEIKSAGQGAFIQPQEEIKFNFTKYNALGDTLESTYDPQKQAYIPRTMPFQSLDKGLQIAFSKMKPGGKYKVFIPGKMAAFNNQRYQAFSYEIDLIASTKKGTFVLNSPQ